MSPIEGATPEDAADRFVRHLNDVLSKTVTHYRLRRVRAKGYFQIAFEEEDAPAGQAPLKTRFGTIWLYIGQLCETRSHTISRRRAHRLQTREYKYTLTHEDDKQPVFRWEYVRYPTKTSAAWCRHHLQGPLPVPLLASKPLTLDDLHLPTGYVPIEEILRFCISDLGVRPRQRDWHEVLEESYRQFREEFAEFGTI